MTEAPATSPLRRAAGLAGNVIAVVGVAFVVRALWSRVDALPPLSPTPALLGALAAGVVAHVVSVMIGAVTWRALLGGAGVDYAWRDSFRAIGVSALAKYVPGNIFHLVGRAAVATSDGVPAVAIVGTLALEAAMVLVAAAFVGSPALATRIADLRALVPAAGALVAVAAVVAGVGVAVSFVAVRALRRRQARTSVRALAVAFALDVVSFVLLGAGMACTLGAVLPDAPLAPGGGALLVATVPAFAIAWTLGFVVPGAPGGIGVREAAFVLLLPLPGDAARAAVVVALVIGRVQAIVGDLVVFAAARALPRPPRA